MATAFIRIKVDLPDDKAAEFVRARRLMENGEPDSSRVGAKEIADRATSVVVHDLQGCVLVRRFGATITHHPK